MILTNNKSLPSVDNKLLNNTSFTAFIIDENFFPRSCSSTGTPATFELKFSEATQVVVNWGDGTTETFDTFFENGEHIFRVKRYTTGNSGIGFEPDPLTEQFS